MAFQRTQWYIFAATHDGIVRSELQDLWTQSKSSLHPKREGSLFGGAPFQLYRCDPGAGQSGDLALNYRRFQSADAGRLSDAENIVKRRLLSGVDLYEGPTEPATQQRCKFGVRN